MGTVFPYLLRLAEGRPGSAGATVGRLAAVNTVAAIAGSLVAGFFLLGRFGVADSLRWVAGAYLAAAVVAPGRALAWPLRAAGAVLLALLVATPAGLPRVHLDAAQGETLVAVRESVHGTAAVVRRGDDLRLKVNNSYLLGTSASALNLRIQSYLPLALHGAPGSVFYLGMGTGITAGGALDFPVRRVVVAEIDPDVAALDARYFAPYLNGLLADPRVELVLDDGRAWLQGTTERFDVVIGDIFLTYREGVGSLYTREHFTAVRDHLRPGGIFAQWLTLFDLSERELGSIVRTLREVFPQVTLWRRGFSPRFPVYALVASPEERPLPAAALAAELARLETTGALPARTWLSRRPLAAYAGNLGDARGLFPSSPVNTDDRTWIEWSTPRTERRARGAGLGGVLAWDELPPFLERVLERLPPAADPFLAGLPPGRGDEVLAGLAFQRYEVAARQGRAAEAARELTRFELLAGVPAGPPAAVPPD